MTDIEIDMARRIELERADARKVAMDEAIKRIEGLEGNQIYRQAWKLAVRSIRAAV